MRPIVSLPVLLAVILAGPGHSQSVVYGESPAAACYHDAAAVRGDLDALQDCEEALRDPALPSRDRAATFSNRGIIKLNRGQPEAALTDFDRAESLGLDDPGVLGVNRSSAFLRLDRPAEALAAADIAIAAQDSNAPAAWYNRGLALEEMGDIPGAFEAYGRALELRPSWALPARELERFRVEEGS